jgi:hypothetical protein
VDGDRGKVWAILNAYLVDLQNRVHAGDAAERTYQMHHAAIAPFNEKCGELIRP